MWLNFINHKTNIDFTAGLLEETNAHLNNPYRGWYRIFLFELDKKINMEELHWSVNKDEELVFVSVSLKAYRNISLDANALENLQSIFDFFRREKKQIILRLRYDTEGKGLENEPQNLSKVLKDIKDLAPILIANSDLIFTIQGVLIGSWGEMHTSRFLEKNNLSQLINAVSCSVTNKVYLAVRTPLYRRSILAYDGNERLADRLGLYNDGMLSSETDYGTYPNERRQQELDYQDRICQLVPNGGEVINPCEYNDLDTAVVTLRKMHITYLNCIYDMQVIDKWKSSIWNNLDSPDVYNGLSGYEYIGRHLGYRFVVRECRLVNKKKVESLSIIISNVGFSRAYVPMELSLLLTLKDEKAAAPFIIKTKEKPESWLPGCSYKIEIDISNEISSNNFIKDNLQNMTYDCYLNIYCRAAQKNVLFANKGMTDKLYLGTLSFIF